MRFPLKTLGLLLASLVLASCGGGGGDGGGGTSPPANGTMMEMTASAALSAPMTAAWANSTGVSARPGRRDARKRVT